MVTGLVRMSVPALAVPHLSRIARSAVHHGMKSGLNTRYMGPEIPAHGAGVSVASSPAVAFTQAP